MNEKKILELLEDCEIEINKCMARFDAASISFDNNINDIKNSMR